MPADTFCPLRGSRRLEAGVAAAASLVVDAMHEVSSEIRAASEIMNWGFSAMLDELADMRASLKELVRCAREPSQTSAYEQFNIARDNFRRGHYEDCLKRLQYAIDGFQSHVGFPEEWRFHQLMGDIYLQCPMRSLIDLPRAERSFVLAAKYAEASPASRAMALTAAAVAAYNQGRMDSAEDYAQLRGIFSGNDRLMGMCNELYDHREWLWTFVEHEGVESTNNTAERSLRHAVIWRKLSFGTQIANGSRFVERMLTTIETCRLQKRNVFGYLTVAVQAHIAHRPAPSLLPAP